jgi:hypothetical protein
LGYCWEKDLSTAIEVSSQSQVISLKGFLELPGQDSNLDKENQNLLCYRYTTGYQDRLFVIT